ncbi:MAG: class I SAM-dependent methyltransferase [Natronospirillum sp.]
MSPFSEVLLRWFNPQAAPRCLLLNMADTELAAHCLAQGMAVQHTHFAREQHVAHAELKVPTLAFPEQSTELTDVCWQWPKAKEEATMLLDWLAPQLADNGSVWIVGHNKGGIKSAAKLLEARGWHVQKKGSARHCALLRATRALPAQDFVLERYWTAAALPEGNGTLWTLPGVFSHGRIDRGSQVLLPFLKDLRSPVLDFGCGGGLLSLVSKLNAPELAVTALDHHWLAILSTQKTATENGVVIDTLWSHGFNEVTGRYGALITNPPFHTGIETDYDIASRLITGSRAVLKPRSRWLAVVNVHLPYEPWITEHLAAPSKLIQQNGFVVWEANTPH